LLIVRPVIARSLLLAFTASYWFLLACHRGPQPQADHPQLAAGTQMQDITFHSNALNRQMRYRVFLPVHAPSTNKLPVVYLLHGGGSDFRAWSNDSDVSQYAARGLILVMPEGDESYYMNEVEAPEKKFEDYITNDLIADVESRFPARGDRNGRAIIGISMGGFAAVEYALSRSELFCFVGALSPSIDVPFRHFNIRRIDQWWKFRTIFGPSGSKERSARDPSRLVLQADPKATPYLYVTAGEQEPLLQPNRQFVSQLKKHGFTYEFHTRPGGHDWNEWNAQLPGCFAKLFEIIPTNSNLAEDRSP
jgi:putative tributyrin esterase